MNEKTTDQRVLIIDDEPEFGEYVRRVASDLGYEAKAVNEGEAFCALYQSFQPTVIVLDMVMPDMDGNEIVLWLTEQGYDANLIIITGYSLDYAADAKRLAEFKGMRSVTALTKPILLADLRAALQEHADEYALA